MTGAARFDDQADHYDSSFTDRRVARILRATVREELALYIEPNCDVLEIGCGTGEDAIWLAENDCNVFATDVSENMLHVARSKAGRDIKFGVLDASAPAIPETIGKDRFDLVFSNFGALNCVRDLSVFAGFVSECLREDGLLVANLMNRYCAWESIDGLLRAKPKRVSRRWSGRARWTGGAMDVYYPIVSDLRGTFAQEFRLIDVKGIGVFLPPSERFDAFDSRPRLTGVLACADAVLAGWWSFNRLGDHLLLVFRKR